MTKLNEPPKNSSVTPFQETFDKGLAGINKQGVLGRHILTPCYYIPERRLRCVIGHLVSDTFIHLMTNAYEHVGTMLPKQRILFGLDKHDLDLMCAMQDAHDAACNVPNDMDAMREFYLCMISVAQTFHINAEGIQL